VGSNNLTIFAQAFSEKANINNYQRRNYQTARHGYGWRETNQVRGEIEGEQQNETGHGFREVPLSGGSNDLLLRGDTSFWSGQTPFFSNGSHRWE
jgi:hypothetical protein